jgi:hypothetical protein
MRLFPILILGLLAYAADPREPAIDAAGTSFVHCWDTRDTECLSKLVTDDFVLVTRNGKLMDKAGFLDGMKAGRYSQSAASATPSPRRDEKVRFYGNTAIVTYAETGLAACGGSKFSKRGSVEIGQKRS